MAEGVASPKLLTIPGYVPQTVRAATATADHMLWILDDDVEVKAGLIGYRLVRIDLYSLKHEVIFLDYKSGVFDSHWLSIDRDGQVLLTASSTNSAFH